MGNNSVEGEEGGIVEDEAEEVEVEVRRADGGGDRLRWPSSIKYIIGNEICER
jgi:hypothetical protein